MAHPDDDVIRFTQLVQISFFRRQTGIWQCTSVLLEKKALQQREPVLATDHQASHWIMKRAIAKEWVFRLGFDL
ncbi:hypothetical protein H5A43_22535 [Pectobacterium brasiliense]|nr:hypothetical protein [Pectobacterium brasiliense]